jgi:RHS repeat-associated protein
MAASRPTPLSWWHRWLSGARFLFRLPVVCRRRFWQDYFALRSSTKDDPSRFPRRRPLLESLESRLAPQSIAAAAAPFALVGWLATETVPQEMASGAAVPPRDEKEPTDLASAATLDSLWTAWQHQGEGARGDALALAHTEQSLVLGEHESVEKKDRDADDKEGSTTSAAQRSGHRPQDRPDGHNLAGATGGGGGGSDAHTPEVRHPSGGGDGGSSASAAPPPDRSGLTSFLDGGGQGQSNGTPAANPRGQASSAAPAAAPQQTAAPATGDAGSTTAAASATATTTGTPLTAVQTGFGQAQLGFVANIGQVADSNTAFTVQHAGFSAHLLSSGAAAFDVAFPSATTASQTSDSGANSTTVSTAPTFDVFGMNLVGAASNPQIFTGDPLPSHTSYFTSSDPAAWHLDQQNFSSITYKNVWNGIDLVYHADAGGKFAFDFQAQPGADLSQIRLGFDGINSSSIDPTTGDLLLQTPAGPVVVNAPAAYQSADGVTQTSVSVQPVVNADGTVSFSFATYNPSLGITLDPTLSYSTYLGGSKDDYAYGVATDPSGNVWVTGSTASTNFPTTSGVYQGSNDGGTDAFVTKLDPSGKILWSTYLGGPNNDSGSAIAVDTAGNSYIAGSAGTGFPSVNAISGQSYPSPFIAELTSGGDGLTYATPLNASGLGAIAVDANGAAYVTGNAGSGFTTTGGSFQTTFGGGTGGTDATLSKIHPGGGSLDYSTYIGGNQNDFGSAVQVDASGHAFVAGDTFSSNFPVTAGAYMTTYPGSGTNPSNFVVEINAAGSAEVYGTYAGQISPSNVGLALDSAGNAYLTGSASSSYPKTPGSFGSATSGLYLSKLNSTGSSVVYSGVLAGGTATAVALDGGGDAIMTGYGSSIATTSGAFQGTFGGGSSDAFAIEVNPTGSTVTYATYLGGSLTDAGTAIAVDVSNNAYIAGYTNSTNFPTSHAAQATNAGGYDAFISKLSLTPPAPVIVTISQDTGRYNNDQITKATTITLSGYAQPGSTVTLYRNGVGLLGSVPCSGGTWTYNYGATLPEGVASFYGTDTLGGLSSAPSADFLVTVDLTPPTINLSVPATTYSLGPQVQVTASDLNGLPNGTTVTLDLTHNGTTTMSYTGGTLTDGHVTIKLPTLAAGTGTYTLTGHVLDLAGNMGMMMATFTVANNPSPWTVTGQSSGVVAGGDATLQLGNVSTGQTFYLEQSGPSDCGCSTASLVYNSDWTSVKPFVQVSVPTDTASSLPSSITATLIFNGVTQTAVTCTVSGAAQGDLLTLSEQVSSAVTMTAAYPYTMQLAMNGKSINRTFTGTAYLVSEDSSPFGAGWTFSKTDQLVSVTGGVIRISGKGGWAFYASAGGGSFTSPAGDNGTLSQSGGTYTYSTPSGMTWTFNSSGYQTQWTSPDGQSVWQYSCNGSNQLTGITAPDGTVSTITYSSGLAQTIAVGGVRTTSLAYSGSNLTQITNPDGGTHTFAYDGNHHLTSETIGGTQNQWAYTSAGVLGTFTMGSSTGPGGASNTSTTTVLPGLTRGLSALVVGTVWASSTDPNSHTLQEQLDSQGKPTQSMAPEGGVTNYGYSLSGGQDAYVTSITDPLNRTTTFARDSAGYVTLETLPDGNTISMSYQSAFHALTQSTDERGHSTTYAYDNTTGHLTSTTDALGHTTTQSWNTSGEVQSVTDANNHTTTYLYDSNRRLTTVIDAMGNRTTSTYDSNGYPLSVTDANGHTSTTLYDSMGRLTVSIDALGNRTTNTYDSAGLLQTSLDPLGHKTSYVYDGFNRGLVAQVFRGVGTSAQSSVQFGYDSAGNTTSTTDGLGQTSTAAFDMLGRVTQATDAAGDVTLAVYDLDGEVTSSRDPLGNITKYAYNNRGWVTQTTDAAGNTTSTGYDAAGNATTETDQLGHTTTLAYDNLNRATLITDPLSHTTSVAFDSVGNVKATTDANGHQTTLAYDALDRLTAMTEAAGTAVAQTSSTGYDAVGNVTTQTDGLGHTTTFALDALNRVTQTTDPQGDTTSVAFDAAGNMTTSTDGLGKTTTMAYDALNRATSVTDPLGHTTTIVLDADSQTVGSIDALGTETQYGYDAVGRPIQTIDALAGVTRAVYDAAGNPLEVIDSVGNITSAVYDRLNRQIQMTDPTGHTATQAYDAASRVTSQTDRLGRVMTYAYDNADRLTAETWLATGGTIVQNTQRFSYDNDGNTLTAADNVGTYTFGYDALNRLTSQTDVFGVSLTFSYDSANNRTLVQDSLGGTLTSVYDSANRLTSRQFSGNSMQLRIDPGYNARNDLTSLTRYGTTGTTMVVGTTTYGIDDAGRITAITNKNGSSTTLSYYNSAYDAANRITQETWGSGGTTGTHVYSYDKTNQLLSDGSTTYSYDLNGNRTMSGYSTGSDNRLTYDGTYTYTYNAEGDITQKVSTTATWTYGWDNMNRMVGVKEVTTTGTQLSVSYSYDVLGNRLEDDTWKASTGTTLTVRHAYDDRGNIWADVTTTNTLLARYVYGDGVNQVWARAIPAGLTNAGVAWYLTDREGSVRDIMDSSGVIRDHIDYDGYGNPTHTTISFADSHGYAGGQTDLNTGLVQEVWRWYGPGMGGWMSEDPSRFAGGINLNEYGGNDPTNLVDPSGLAPDGAQTIGNWLSELLFGTADPVLLNAKVFAGGIANVPTPVGALDALAPLGGAAQVLQPLVKPVATRAIGVARILGGVGGGATAMAVVETPAAVVAVPLSAWSADQIYTGGKQIWTGEFEESYGAQVIKQIAGNGITGNVGAFVYDVGPDAYMLYRAITLPGNTVAEMPTGFGVRPVPAAPRTAGYKTLAGELEGTGLQANHLNQNAVFRDIIPEAEGLSVGMRGNAFTEVGSPHYEFHRALEGFWNLFRKGGARFGQTPTNAEYSQALEQALRAGGLSAEEAANLAAQAARQRAAYGLAPNAQVPRIPGRMGQTPPPCP